MTPQCAPVRRHLIAKLVLTAALTISLVACGDEEPELSLPSAVDEPAETGLDTAPSDQDPEPDDEQNDDAPPVSEQAADGEFVPTTVHFDPENPPDQATLDQLMLEAVEAEFDNALWCWENASTCDLDRHVGPSITDARLAALRSDFQASFPEGTGNYIRGAQDGIRKVEVQAFADQEFNLGDDEFRLVGSVVTCDVYGGTYSYPEGDDVSLDVGMVAEYRVWQDVAGGLRVAQQAVVDEGRAELCEAMAEQ